MSTGYTSGILNGTINTFEEFATVCTRGFGATIHMIDESLESPYKPRTPSEYYTKSIQEKREKIEKYNTLSDEDLLAEMQKGLKEDLEYCKKRLEELTKNLEKLNSILESAKSWVPPTEEYELFRVFMIDQLVGTIEQDGDPSYYVEKIMKIEKELEKKKNIRAERESAIKKIEKEIFYYEIEHQKELERCKKSNKWMESLLESIKNNERS